MITKDELLAKLDTLVELTRTRTTATFSLLFLPPALAKRTSDLSKQCFDLQKKILGADDKPATLIDLHREVIDLDLWVRRRIAKNNLLPTVAFIYVGFIALFLILRFIDVPAFIEKTLGVQAPGRLVTLGVAGAFIYLATSAISRTDPHPDTQVSGVISFSIRLMLAVVVPIVLVVLFFDTQGLPRKLSLTPEILSFICGYSSKLVIEVFNKLVEKVSKMIHAL